MRGPFKEPVAGETTCLYYTWILGYSYYTFQKENSKDKLILHWHYLVRSSAMSLSTARNICHRWFLGSGIHFSCELFTAPKPLTTAWILAILHKDPCWKLTLGFNWTLRSQERYNSLEKQRYNEFLAKSWGPWLILLIQLVQGSSPAILAQTDTSSTTIWWRWSRNM